MYFAPALLTFLAIIAMFVILKADTSTVQKGLTLLGPLLLLLLAEIARRQQ